MSDPNTPNEDAQNGTPNRTDGNPSASDAQPTTPLTRAPADTQDFQATTPIEPQVPQAPQVPPAPQFAPQAPQQFGPGTPQAPQAPQAPQQFGPGAPQAPQQFGPGAPQAPGAPQQFGPGAPQAPGAPGYPYVPPQPKGLALTALIVGIVAICSLIFGWIPFVGAGFSIICGAAAVVLGIIAMNKAQSKGMSITGLITGGIAVLAGIGIIIAWSVFFANAGSMIDDYSSTLDELQSELDNYDHEYEYGTESNEGGSTSPDAVGEYTAAFCDALTTYSDETASGLATSDNPLVREALEVLASEESPNQDVYQRFLDVTSPGAAVSESDVSSATIDLSSAFVEDYAGCITYMY